MHAYWIDRNFNDKFYHSSQIIVNCLSWLNAYEGSCLGNSLIPEDVIEEMDPDICDILVIY